MKLLAVSGGPDSMFLLNWYKNKKIVVACVNYNIREDSNNDQKIVEDFCRENNIPYEILSISEEYKGNFQSWARKIRYDFFKEVYIKYQCTQLMTGHHRDDFLETSLMQQRSQRTPEYFGIRKNNIINDMKVYRPFIDLYWKNEILWYLKQDKIKFAIDSSNNEPIYERNKIRIELKEKSAKEKKSIVKWFKLSNKILKKKHTKINIIYKKWEKKEFKTDYLNLYDKYKEELAYKFIHTHFQDVKLKKGMLDAFIQFANGKDGGKTFIINGAHSITKKKRKLIVI
ncbi:MAG: tRNA lysidine(34) synthetase TilS [Mycoplasmataceae bacterium]|nr:tRNA lysidine(34) synthetase TilS [Mycoplasmataceae bacterium]